MQTFLYWLRRLLWLRIAIGHFVGQDIDAPYQGPRLVLLLRTAAFGFVLPLFFWWAGAIPLWGGVLASFAIYMAMGEYYWHTKEWWVNISEQYPEGEKQ